MNSKPISHELTNTALVLIMNYTTFYLMAKKKTFQKRIFKGFLLGKSLKHGTLP